MRDFVINPTLVALVLRFHFRLLAANPSAGFVDFLHSSTLQLLQPFTRVLSPYVIEPGYVLEFSTLIAMVIYAAISRILVELICFIQEDSRTRQLV